MGSGMRIIDKVGVESVGDLVRQWGEAGEPFGLLALLPEAGASEAVAVVQAVCREASVPLVGAVFPALVCGARFVTQGAVLLRLDAAAARSAKLHQGLTADPQAAGRIAEALSQEAGEGRDATLMMIFDAMVPNIASILEDVYAHMADQAHYMGVNAGSESFQPMPCLFDNECLVGDGVLTIMLRPHQGAILEHGYSAPPEMIVATSTAGNRIVDIDWRPAFEVYREMAKAQFGVDIDHDNFYQYGVRFPFGIIRASGEILVRIPVALEEDGSLFCVGEVPPNSMLTLLRAPEVDSTRTVESVVQGLRAMNGPLTDLNVLLFYCAGRRLYLGERAADELRAFEAAAGAAQVAGAISLGEIGAFSRWGYPLFHNATLVASRWG